jgi:hypothetical protein
MSGSSSSGSSGHNLLWYQTNIVAWSHKMRIKLHHRNSIRVNDVERSIWRAAGRYCQSEWYGGKILKIIERSETHRQPNHGTSRRLGNDRGAALCIS